MNKIFLVRIDHGNGWVDHYVPTTAENVAKVVAKRGCDQITFREAGTSSYNTMTWDVFKNYFELS